MGGNSFCMLLAGFFAIILFGAFTALGTSWGLVEGQYARVPIQSWILVGGLTANSVTIKLKLPAADAFVLLVSDNLETLSSTSPGTTSVPGRQEIPLSNSLATTTRLERQYEIQTIQVQDLQPNTNYYYEVQEKSAGGSPLDDNLEGSFQTPPAQGTRRNYTIATAGCAWTASRAQIFNEIKAMNPLFFLHLGDFHYEDIRANNMQARMDAVSQVMASDTQRSLYRTTSLAYMWDDHDFLDNDSDGIEEEEGALNTALRSYQLAFPHYPLPALEEQQLSNNNNQNTVDGNVTTPVPVYHAFTIGTIRYILSDLRSEATLDHIYSETQANWLREELSLAANYDFVIWVTTKPWIGIEEPLDDAWYGFVQDRQELSDYISNTLGVNDGPQNLLALSADAHMVAFDNGTNTYYGNNSNPDTVVRSFPILHSGSLDRTGSAKGGPFTDGCFAFEMERTHQFSTLQFLFLPRENGQFDKCIQIDSYRNVDFSNTPLETIFSKRLCNQIFATAATDRKVGVCEIDRLWHVNDAIAIAASALLVTTMILSCIAIQNSDATNIAECCCKSCLSSTLVFCGYVVTLAIGLGTPVARGIGQFDIFPSAIIVLLEAICWIFYLGIWWGCCATSPTVRTRRDENDPAFLDVEPNYHIQDMNLDLSTHER